VIRVPRKQKSVGVIRPSLGHLDGGRHSETTSGDRSVPFWNQRWWLVGSILEPAPVSSPALGQSALAIIRSAQLASALALLALAVPGCRGTGAVQGPHVQDSAEGAPRTFISINRILSGRYRAIAPSCIGQQYLVRTADGSVQLDQGLSMRPGDVAEFDNFLPDVPTNVTALDAPGDAVMFSPNLVRPYNIRTEAGETFSFWRYRFPEAGVYEYFDTNMGEPGRKVVDSYYGTVSFIGESSAPKGVVCVDPPACLASAECMRGGAAPGTNCCACIGVCCTLDEHCATANTCLRGRCVDAQTGQ
jgi:hypothetical protein